MTVLLLEKLGLLRLEFVVREDALVAQRGEFLEFACDADRFASL